MQGFGVDLPLDPVVGEKSLDLGREMEMAVGSTVVERADTHPVPCEKKFSFEGIPDGEGELAIDLIQAGRTKFLVQMENDLRVGIGGENVPFLDQARFQLRIIERLPVIDNPQSPVLVTNGLGTTVQTNDTEPGMGQTDTRIDIDTGFIRPAVPHGGEHLDNQRFGDPGMPAEVEDSGYPTHAARGSYRETGSMTRFSSSRFR